MPPRRPHVVSYRSGLERTNAERLNNLKIPFEFEAFSIPFVQPEKHRKYTPDFLLLLNGILVETKGEFVTADRQKHLFVREQHPLLDIRFVFSNPKAKIYKGSPTTHAMWAESHGFLWAAKTVPQSWLKEPVNQQSIDHINQLRKRK